MTTYGELVRTSDGTFSAVHPQHGEKYHSDAGAGLEANDLFVRGSGLSPAVRNRILDVGLGLGYNAFAVIREWLLCTHSAECDLISLEINPELAQTVLAMPPWMIEWLPPTVVELYAQARDQDNRDNKDSSTYSVTLSHPLSGAKLHWQVLVGDGALVELPGEFTHIFQDAFSPPVNPELWTTRWFGNLRSHSQSGCVLMTYSVARTVRDALAASGWSCEKIPTTTAKRSWLRAVAVPAKEAVGQERGNSEYREQN